MKAAHEALRRHYRRRDCDAAVRNRVLHSCCFAAHNHLDPHGPSPANYARVEMDQTSNVQGNGRRTRIRLHFSRNFPVAAVGAHIRPFLEPGNDRLRGLFMDKLLPPSSESWLVRASVILGHVVGLRSSPLCDPGCSWSLVDCPVYAPVRGSSICEGRVRFRAARRFRGRLAVAPVTFRFSSPCKAAILGATWVQKPYRR